VQTSQSAIGFASASGVPCDATLSVDGVLPSWLRGTFIHTGPALFELERKGYASWFDGLAMLASVELGEERVRYRSRWLESDAYRAAVRRGAPAFGEFRTPPDGWLRRLGTLLAPSPTDNANVNVAHLGDRVIAMTESTRQRELDPRALTTGAEHAYADDLEGHLSTAHPEIDRRRNLLYNLLVRFGRRSSYELYELPLGQRTRRRVASLPVDQPAYVHSFAASEQHLVLTETPLCVHPLRMRFSPRPFIERYAWRPERGTRVRVVRKVDGEVVSDVRTAPLFLFHHVNAVDVAGRVDVDLVSYPDPALLAALRLTSLRGPLPRLPAARLCRLSIPLGVHGERIEPSELFDGLELPRIDPRCESRSYRFLWGVANRATETVYDHLVRVDLGGGPARRFARPGWFPNEPLFVPAPGAGAEDAGVVLCTMLDAEAGASKLAVLDGGDLELRAQVTLPHVVPFHFHSQFFSPSAVDAAGRN
jgi:beta,beta-carotene 9',10'-dioxygenase